MTYAQAVTRAIKALEDERKKRWSFDAGLFRQGVVTVRTTTAAKEYDALTEAIELIRATPPKESEG